MGKVCKALKRVYKRCAERIREITDDNNKKQADNRKSAARGTTDGYKINHDMESQMNRVRVDGT